jgi:excisionase family DNA binding protein
MKMKFNANTKHTDMDTILQRLDRIERLMTIQMKEALTAAEVALMLDVTEGRVRTLTSQKKIPYYKCGTKTYYKKSELERWMLSQRVATQDELEIQAQTYTKLKRLNKNTRRGVTA